MSEKKWMTPGQYRELYGAVIRLMPGLFQDQAQAWIDDPAALKDFLSMLDFPEEATQAPFRAPQAKSAGFTRVPIPAEGQVFQLRLDADRANPRAVVSNAQLEHRGWTFRGPVLEGVHFGHFKLIWLTVADGLPDARAQAHALGCELAEAQWCEAFRVRYPHIDHGGYIAFGGETSEWLDHQDDPRFPALEEGGRIWVPRMPGTSDVFRNWRWLVRERSSQ